MATTSPQISVTLGTVEQLAPAEPGQIVVIWRRYRKHKLGLIGFFTLLVMTALCIAAPLVSPHDPARLDLLNTFGPTTLSLQSPHWLGTDEFGRDIFTRLLYAGRISLTVGILVTLVTVIAGALVGVVAGYFGGILDTILMRFVDLLSSLPGLPILLVASRMLSQYLPTMVVIIIVLSLLGWLGVSRLVRGSVLALRDLEFVEATRALGAGSGRIILRHLLPNSLGPIIVASTLSVGGFILTESALSFLGFGIQPPTPSWGNMLADVNSYFLEHPLLAFYPGLAILLTVVSINFMGDALRDALDPRLKL
jgi:peptide/nickel transport system permease protein